MVNLNYIDTFLYLSNNFKSQILLLTVIFKLAIITRMIISKYIIL